LNKCRWSGGEEADAHRQHPNPIQHPKYDKTARAEIAIKIDLEGKAEKGIEQLVSSQHSALSMIE
jgi:hypothetical protein